MFIQTEATADPHIMKFLPGRDVYPAGPLSFDSPDAAARAPLAIRLLNIDHVTAVELGADYISVTKSDEAEWLHLKPAVLGAIMDHFVAGLPVVDRLTDLTKVHAVVVTDIQNAQLLFDALSKAIAPERVLAAPMLKVSRMPPVLTDD